MTESEKQPVDSASSQFSANKIPLLRQLSITSLVAMVVTAAILIFYYQQDQQSEHEQIALQDNVEFSNHLMHLLDAQLYTLVSSSAGIEPSSLRTNPNVALFASDLMKVIDNSILKVKVFNSSGIAVYSSVESEIGRASRHPDWMENVLRGQTESHIKFCETFHGAAGDLHDVYVSSIYMPLNHAGKRIGVFEVYVDSTPVFKRINENIIRIVQMVFGVFVVMYAVLFFIARNAERAIADWQKRITESEETLRESQIIAGLGSYDLCVHTGQWKSSEVLDQLFGIGDAYEHSVAGWEALLHPDDRAMMVDYLRNYVIGQRQTFDKEFRIIRHSDQAVRWVHALGKLKLDAHGHPVKMHGTLRDITNQNCSLEKLRIAAVAFETQEGMAVTDERGLILQVNKAFTLITGYTAEDAVGQSMRLIKSGRHDEAFYKAMWESILRHGWWEGEIWNRRKNGEVYPEYQTITAVKNEQGGVTHFVATLHDITERKVTEEKVNNLAFYDTLTRLPNRRLLDDRLEQAIAASKRSGRYGAVMFLDLDNFKPLNDNHGHRAGDMLLVEVGNRLVCCVREVDTVARFGGDEFVVVLSELDADKSGCAAQAGVVAEKIRAALAEPYWLAYDSEGTTRMIVNHHCAASIGVVLFNSNVSAERILQWADMAMYQAKAAGRNSIRFYGADE